MAGGVFVIGCPRSGTTALGLSLGQHPRFWVSLYETDFIYRLLVHDPAAPIAIDRACNGGSDKERSWLIDNRVNYREFASYLGLGLEMLLTSRSKDRRWVDHAPSNMMLGTTLPMLFPEASFLHIVRDGRAVISSMLASQFNENFAQGIASATRVWRDFVHVGLEMEKNLPADKILRVRHEDLVATPEHVAERVMEFLGEAQDPTMAKFLRGKRVNSSYQGTNVSALTTLRFNDWPQEWRDYYDREAGEVARTLGYPTFAEDAEHL